MRKAEGMRSAHAHQGWDILFGWIPFDHSVYNTERRSLKRERKGIENKGREGRKKKEREGERKGGRKEGRGRRDGGRDEGNSEKHIWTLLRFSNKSTLLSISVGQTIPASGFPVSTPNPDAQFTVTHQTDTWLALAVHQCLPKPKTGDESPALPLGVPRIRSS